MREVLLRLFGWLLGEAPVNQRKFVFAARLEMMLFALEALNLWQSTGKGRTTITEILVGAMVTVALITIGGNAVEWGTKAVTAKRTGNQP